MHSRRARFVANWLFHEEGRGSLIQGKGASGDSTTAVPVGTKHHGPETHAALRAGRGVASPPAASRHWGDYSSVTEPRVSIFSRVFLAASTLA